jgi:ribosome-binding factor A
MANLRRIERANELLREIIGDFLVHRLRDPRLQFVTVTEVQLSPDFQHGKVYFTVLGGEQREQEALAALQSAEPLIREEINRNVHWRFIPRLTFIVDKRIEKAMSVFGAFGSNRPKPVLFRLQKEHHPKSPAKKRTRRTSKSRS